MSCAFLFCGCGDSTRPADLPKLYSCKITVIQGGKPLEDATVTLLAKTPSKYGVSSATTDVSGTAVLCTYGFNGVPVGEYGVTITKIGVEDAKESKTIEGNPIQIGGKVYSYVDAVFGNENHPPYTIMVTKKGVAETFDIGTSVRIFLRNNDQY
ncbi:MAG: carboxypeptidase-like regulatory domain-containing protein [Planctomycetaceae bacterium]|nr:carboxypeptidase-like regulatory domain-containing protein [Planctomycetaceae bacterium]